MGALVCFSLVGVRADPLSTSPETPRPGVMVAKPLEHATAPDLPKSLTSVVVDFGEAPRGESVKLLDAPVTFSVKDASFLSALDAVLASAGRSCRVECRGVKAMKLSLRVKGEKAAPVLDALATAGGCDLWVLPSKLIIAPEALLTDTEKKTAKQFGVLLSKNTLPPGSILGHVVKINQGDFTSNVDILDVANTKVSVDFNNASWESMFESTNDVGFKIRKAYSLAAFPPESLQNGSIAMAHFSASMQNVSFGEVLAFMAHMNGCELYLLPDRFVICGPDEQNLTSQDKKQAVSAFTSSSTHFDFDGGSSAPDA
jgi:hypothetical protein